MQDDANIEAPETDLPETEANESGLDNLISTALDNFSGADDNSGPSRDERGRFASAKAEGDQPEAKTEAVATEVQPALNEQPIEPPARWTEADKAAFAALPREAQALLSERNKAMEADYTRKTQEIAEFRRHAEPLLNAVQPYGEYLNTIGQQMGRHPAELIQNLLNVEYRLRTGSPQEKAQALAKIAADYGIAPQPMGTADGQQPMAAQPDPYVNHLYQQMPQIEQKLNQLEQTYQQIESERQSLQVEAFRNAKDASGQLLHPYFEDVRSHMAALIATGSANTFEEAYALAVQPINKVMQSSQAISQQANDKARQEAVEKAKRAAPVRIGGSSPKGVTAARGLDNVLSSALDQVAWPTG